MELEELLVQIKADTSQLVSGLKDAQAAVSDSSKQMTAALGDMSKGASGSMSALQSVFATMAAVFGGDELSKAVGAIEDAFKQLFNLFVTDGVKGAMAQEDAINLLNNAMARAGQYSQEASSGFVEFADEMQKVTKFSNDQIISSGSLIESLAQLDEKGLQTATKAAMDLAAGLGIDLNTAALLVGKAAEGQIGTFTRYGLVVSQGATNAETFANTLQAINDKFGGSAVTSAQTFSGVISILGHDFDDVTKSIGNTIVQNQAIIDVIKVVSQMMVEWSVIVKNNTDDIKKLVAEGLIYLIQAGTLVGVTLDAAFRVSTAAINLFRTAVDAVGIAFLTFTDVLNKEGRNAIVALANDAATSAKKIGTSFTEDTKLQDFTQALMKLEDAAKTGFKAIETGANNSVTPINKTKTAVAALSAEMAAMGDAGKLLADNLSKINTTIQNDYTKQTNTIKLAMQSQKLSISQGYMQESDALIEKFAKENALMQAAFEQGKISNSEYNQALIDNNIKFQAEQTKMDDEQLKQQNENNKKRVADLTSTLGMISTLESSKNAELFFIGQQAAAANAIINTFEGVSKAWALGPILGPPLATLVAIAGAAQVAGIESQSPPGFAGGLDMVPGSGSEDNFPAMLAPGEGVLTSNNNKKLTQILNQTPVGAPARSSSGGGSQQIHIHIGGKTIVETINNELRGGRKLAV